MHEEKSFITLTYDDDHLPHDYGVHVEHFQKFMKRLRKQIEPKRVRYLGCGEYGDGSLRPHYHLILFGHEFLEDRVLWRRNNRGDLLYRSPSLEKVWNLGNSEFGAVTKESGDYVARYVMKKIGGAMAEEHYRRIHPVSGRVSVVSPEFLVCSTRPGIASKWFEKFESDVYPADFVVVNGTRYPVPKYFDKKLASRNEDENRLLLCDDLSPMRDRRKKFAKELAENSTPERLQVREKCHEGRIASLKRNLGGTDDPKGLQHLRRQSRRL